MAWAAQGLTAQWSIPDPIGDGGSEAQLRKNIKAVAHQLQQRISFLTALSGEALQRLVLETRQGNNSPLG